MSGPLDELARKQAAFRMARQMGYVGAAPTLAQEMMSTLGRLPGVVSQGFQGNAIGTTDPHNAISDMARSQFWRGSVFGEPEDLKQRNMQRALDIALAAPTTWHGSPYLFKPTAKNPLGEFDPTKIGTGEGAQAYGHGHYLAENPGVAKGYRDKLAKNEVLLDGQKVTHNRADLSPQSMGLNALQMEPNPEAAAKALRNAVSDESLWQRGSQYDHRENYSAAANWLEQNAKRIKVDSGSLYKIDLPDAAAAKMLDWDKPLSQQAPEVQEALIKAKIYDQVKVEKLRKELNNLIENKQLDYADLIEHRLNKLDPVAGKLVKSLELSKSGKGSAKNASEYLRDLGIPGIRYLDQGSRAGGQGTSNYVVFPGNEHLLKILERK